MNIEQMSEVLGVRLNEVKLDPQLLNNDHQHYQRKRIESRVQEILFSSKPSSLPIIAAERKEDGSFWIINGQHHAEAYVRTNVQEVVVWIFTSDSFMNEMKVFSLFQQWQLSQVERRGSAKSSSPSSSLLRPTMSS